MFGAPDVGGVRDALDAYYTPSWCTRALIDYLGPRLRGVVWEPCAGNGAIVDVLRAHAEFVHTVLASDIAPRRDDISQANFLDCEHGFFGTLAPIVDTICTNPPYSTDTGTATDCVEKAIQLAPNVAMLLRIGWLEPCEDRCELLTKRPPTDIIILPRVNYIGAPKGNNQTSVWVIWSDGEPRRPTHTYGPEIRGDGYWSRR